MNDEIRTRKVAEIRKDGFIPGVMYGHGIEPVSVQVETLDFHKSLRQFGQSKTFSITLDGKKHIVYIKEVQKAFMDQGFEHFDLMRVTKKDTLHASIPLHFIDKDHFQSTTAVFHAYMNELEIEYHVGEGIAHFDVDLSELTMETPILIKHLKLPKGVKPMAEPNDIVCALGHAKVVEEETPESDEETNALEKLWQTIVDCNNANKKLVPIGEYVPVKENKASFAIEE